MMMMMHACHLYIFLEGSVGITSNIDRDFIITYIYIFFFLIIIESIIIVISHHPSIFFLLYNFCSYSSFFCVFLSLSTYTHIPYYFILTEKKARMKKRSGKRKPIRKNVLHFSRIQEKFPPVESTKKKIHSVLFFHFISPV